MADKTFNVGELITDSTLQLNEIFYNKYQCRCVKCGVTDIYTKSELIEDYPRCKSCEDIRILTRDGKLVKGDIDLYNKLKSRDLWGINRTGTEVLDYDNFNGMIVGTYMNQLIIDSFVCITRRDSIGQVTLEKPCKIVLRCDGCGYITIEKLNQPDKLLNISCPNCSKIKEKANKRVSLLIKSKSSHEKTIRNKQVAKRAEKMVPMSKVKSPLDNVKEGSTLSKHLAKIRELNPNLEVADVVMTGSTYTTNCICVECGSEVIIPSTLKKKQVECQGCKKFKINPNYIGMYHKNWIGLSKNNLVITAQYGNKCNVKCKMCGHSENGVSLYDVINNKLFCECEYGDFDGIYFCQSCGKPMTVKIASIVGKRDNTETIKCNNCNEDSGVQVQELVNEQYASDLKTTTCNKLNIAMKEYKNSTVNINGVIKEKEPLYIGTDDIPYYKCRCIEHNTDMILNDTEIANFEHSVYCEDARQHLVKGIDVDNLKL